MRTQQEGGGRPEKLTFEESAVKGGPSGWNLAGLTGRTAGTNRACFFAQLASSLLYIKCNTRMMPGKQPSQALKENT